MMGDKKILVMLPTYNERENVKKMCQELFRTGLPVDILFVDDNSPDGTGEILDELAKKSPHVLVMHRSGKLGIGSAHQDGIAWVYSHGYTHLVTMDCDFTHSPDNIQDLLRFADEYDVIIGSRHILEDSLNGWNLWRKCITKMGHLLTSTLLKMPYDATGAFRLYRLDRISPEIFKRVSSKGYSFFFESLTILNLNRFKIKEIPIALPPRTYGHSKLRFSDMVQWLVFMLGMAWNIHFNKQKYLVTPLFLKY
jgi:dolichol-phosphate mannosyltransferase